MTDQKKITFGIVGGIGPLAGADLFFKLVKSTPAVNDSEHFNVILEQKPLQEKHIQADTDYNPNRRKMHVYNIIQDLASRHADCILLSCFVSHTFLDEMTDAIDIPILDMMAGLTSYVQSNLPDIKKIGVLTSDYVKKSRLFERYFDSPNYELIYPDPDIQAGCLMEAIYGPQGIKAGNLSGEVIRKLQAACRHLTDKGVEVILPGFTEIPVVIDALKKEKRFNILDTNQIYVEWAIRNHIHAHTTTPCLIGIIGGVGPSATVDLMDKIIRNTPAEKDQEHVKMIVEHNPQIPDRTMNLLHGEKDPTISLYTCAKNLESRGANFIVIPCNTAHAFIDRIQRHLSIPILNMIEEVVTFISEKYTHASSIGLLATTGTIQTRIYHRAFEKTDFKLITPDDVHQEMVMQAIYGEKGVKAGFTDGEAKDNLLRAASFLARQGAQVLILGCTELPLLIQECEKYPIFGKEVAILDPTNVLAKKSVSIVLDQHLKI